MPKAYLNEFEEFKTYSINETEEILLTEEWRSASVIKEE